MSRSWTDLFRLGARKAAGLYVGRRQLCAVVMIRGKDGWREESVRSAAVAEPLFEGDPAPTAASSLAQSLLAVSSDLIDGFVPLTVVLPDPVVRYATLELDAIPPSEKMRQELLRWRFSRDMQRPESSIACAGQPMGSDRGKQLFFSQALDRNWLDCLRGAFEQAGLMPQGLNAAAAYRHNLHHDAIDAAGGALITIDTDSWGFQLWDASKRLRYVRSRWRDSSADYELIAGEIERGIRAHSQAADGYRIERIYITGVAKDVEELCGVFDRRLHQSVSRLEASVPGGAAIDKHDQGALLLARAAVMGSDGI